jgi:hypothetical protein
MSNLGLRAKLAKRLADVCLALGGDQVKNAQFFIPVEVPTDFHYFTKLPPELRRMIWKCAAPEARVFYAHQPKPSHEITDFYNIKEIGYPALLQTCRESRHVMLEIGVFTFSRDPVKTDRGLWFRPEVDILYLDAANLPKVIGFDWHSDGVGSRFDMILRYPVRKLAIDAAHLQDWEGYNGDDDIFPEFANGYTKVFLDSLLELFLNISTLCAVYRRTDYANADRLYTKMRAGNGQIKFRPIDGTQLVESYSPLLGWDCAESDPESNIESEEPTPHDRGFVGGFFTRQRHIRDPEELFGNAFEGGPAGYETWMSARSRIINGTTRLDYLDSRHGLEVEGFEMDFRPHVQELHGTPEE